jgi:hypothetical protein
MAFRAEKAVASFFGNNINAPLSPWQAFNSAQQSFRFILEVSGLDIAFIQDVKRPAFTIDYQDYDYLGYMTKFPKKIKWEPVSFSIIETHDPQVLGSVLGNLLQKVQTTAYTYPTNVISSNYKNLSKKNLTLGFGTMIIKTLDPDGRVVDLWRIYNPMVSKITPSALKYSDDTLTNIAVDVAYDWAEYSIGNDIRPGKIAGIAIDSTKAFFGA